MVGRPDPPSPGDRRYACVRVVRERAGAPERPELLLPPGYERVAATYHEGTTPAEYYAFVAGPEGTADVGVRWPGSTVRAVVRDGARLPVSAPDADGVRRVAVPVAAERPRACRGTLAVHSHLPGDPSLRVEHNDPARRAGPYAEGRWVGDEARAALDFTVAARAALRDWGVGERLSTGRLALMGFETNHPLHGDFPPHWHLSYLLPDLAAGSHVPHLYLDPAGRVTANWLAVVGDRRRTRTAGVRDPVPYEAPDGDRVLALDVRPDGGVDVGPRAGEWRYSLVPATDGTAYGGAVRVDRRGKPWRRVACTDDTAAGRLRLVETPLGPDGAPAGPPAETVHRYDPLTGALRG